jgi:hypothetical protein
LNEFREEEPVDFSALLTYWRDYSGETDEFFCAFDLQARLMRKNRQPWFESYGTIEG